MPVSLGCDSLNTTNSLVDQWPASSRGALLKAAHPGAARDEMDTLFCPRKKMKLVVSIAEKQFEISL